MVEKTTRKKLPGELSMDTGSEKGCSEVKFEDSLESSEDGRDWVEEMPLELEGLMVCQSLKKVDVKRKCLSLMKLVRKKSLLIELLT